MVTSTKGIVYILTNPHYKDGLVKIGKTKNLEQRIQSLSRHAGVPTDFSCRLAMKVENMHVIEQGLHATFAKQRVNPNREFFEVDLESAKAALRLTGGEDVTPTEGEEVDQTFQTNQRAPFAFSLAGISIGATIHFASDPRITATVVTDKKIRLDDSKKFGGEEMFLTTATKKIFGRENNAHGPSNWRYKGEILIKRRLRIEKEGHQENRSAPTQRQATKKKRSQKPRADDFSFGALGIPKGAILTFTYHNRDNGKVITATATVHDDRRIKFDGEVTWLTTVAKKLILDEKPDKTGKIDGPTYWKYEGETIRKRRERLGK